MSSEGKKIKSFESFEVTIGDARKAFLALRTYGLSKEVAEKIIADETDIAVYDYGFIPQTSIAPDLIEAFGEQHINEIILYAYHFMDKFDIDWSLLKEIFKTLLDVFKAEELVINPEKIRFFIKSLQDKAFCLMIEDVVKEDPEAIASAESSCESRYMFLILRELKYSDLSTIRKMANDPDDISDDDTDDDIQDDDN